MQLFTFVLRVSAHQKKRPTSLHQIIDIIRPYLFEFGSRVKSLVPKLPMINIDE